MRSFVNPRKITYSDNQTLASFQNWKEFDCTCQFSIWLMKIVKFLPKLKDDFLIIKLIKENNDLNDLIK